MVSKHKTLIANVLLIFSLIYLMVVVFFNRALYTEKYNFRLEEKKFYLSQWSIPNSKNQISDEKLYSYSAYRLIHGGNPIFVNPETPPFGKYLIGLSIVIFQNERIVSIIATAISLVLIYFVGRTFAGSHFAGAVSVFLTSINSLFTDQIIHAPQLDIQQLVFLLLIILSLYQFEKKGGYFFLILAGVFIGLYSSVKVFFLSIALYLAWFIGFKFLKKRRVGNLIFSTFVLTISALTTYTLTYLAYFLRGNTFRDFLGVQKWIVLFYSHSSINMSKLYGDYLGLIFFNKWRFWTEGYPYIRYDSWSILWPAVFLVGTFVSYQILKSKKRFLNPEWIILSFLLIYNAFLFVVPVFPRYLLLLFVPFNLLIALYFDKIFDK